ncbi:hypothetical protein Tco_0966389 [Tanacetum coccineum]
MAADFKENSDEADERSCDEYLRDLELEFHERALLANSKWSKGFQPKFVPKLIQSSQRTQSSQNEPKVQKDYKAEYKKMKAKLSLLEASSLFDEKEEIRVQVLMAIVDDELSEGKNHAHNGEWIYITMKKVNILLSMDEDSDWQNYLKYINIDLKYVEEQRLNLLSKYNKIVFELNKCRDDLLVLKQAKLEAVAFQIQNTELTKLNHALQDQLKKERSMRNDCTNQRITSITVNGKAAYELKRRFLDDLHENAFSGTNEEDTVKHIEYFLKITDPIDLPNAQLLLEAKWDPTNTMFEKGLALKFANHMLMDPFTKNALWDFLKKVDDQEDRNQLVRLRNNVVHKIHEFNYLLKIDTKLFTQDIERTKTYEDYKNEWNNEVDEPWSKNGVTYEICDHICEPFRFKNGKAKWATCNSNNEGFFNGGELPGMVRVGYMTYFQDYEWYDDLTNNSLKEEALKQKAIYEKSWEDATQSVIIFCAWLKRCFRNFHELDYELLVKLEECWWKINDHECSPFANWRDHIRGPYANINTPYNPYLDGRNGRASHDSDIQEKEEQHEEGRCDLFDDPAQEPPVCKIRRFEMIKYSFGQEEEYVAIKEYEYDDLTRTNEDACHAYQ